MAYDFTRRHFFFGSLFAGAIPSGGFGSTASLARLGYKSPNEKLNIASIGAGGQAASDLTNCASENIVALCDVDEKQAARKFSQYEKVPKYKDFRKMLDKEKGIDALIVTIPDFMHATAAMWAMERGKHVQGRSPDGQPGLFLRRHAPGGGDHLVRGNRRRQGGTRLDRPAHLAAGARPNSRARTGPRYPRLGSLAGRRRPAAIH